MGDADHATEHADSWGHADAIKKSIPRCWSCSSLDPSEFLRHPALRLGVSLQVSCAETWGLTGGCGSAEQRNIQTHAGALDVHRWLPAAARVQSR